MIDFEKLMKQTPEERASRAEESRKAFEQQMLDRIRTRTEQIERIATAMETHSASFTQWDKDFIADWQRKAQAKDMTGYVGGKLMDWSANQSIQIQRLSDKTDQLIRLDATGACQEGNAAPDAAVAAPARKGFLRR